MPDRALWALYNMYRQESNYSSPLISKCTTKIAISACIIQHVYVTKQQKAQRIIHLFISPLVKDAYCFVCWIKQIRVSPATTRNVPKKCLTCLPKQANKQLAWKRISYFLFLITPKQQSVRSANRDVPANVQTKWDIPLNYRVRHLNSTKIRYTR